MDEYQKYLNKAIFFLKFRPRSEKEIRDHLTKKPFKRRQITEPKIIPQEILEQVIAWLKEQRFVNDEEFAVWWIEQRTKFKPKGERLIVMELKQKGISQTDIDMAFQKQEVRSKNPHFAEATWGKQEAKSELELARGLVGKKIDKYKGLPKQEVYQKLGAFLGRRGFDWETIKRSIDEVLRDRV